MPAQIVITSGPLVGKVFPIRKAAFRIGRSQVCEICLPDPAIPEHAVTVRETDGAYTVTNRSACQILIDRQAVMRDESRNWPLHRDLRIGPSTSLRLKKADDDDSQATSLAEKYAPEGFQLDDAAAGREDSADADVTASGAARTKPKSSNVVPLTVIALCFVAGAGLLAKKFSRPGATAAAGATPLSREEQLRDLFRRFDEKSRELQGVTRNDRRDFDQLHEALRTLYWMERDQNASGASLQRTRSLTLLASIASQRSAAAAGPVAGDSAAREHVTPSMVSQLEQLYVDFYNYLKNYD